MMEKEYISGKMNSNQTNEQRIIIKKEKELWNYDEEMIGDMSSAIIIGDCCLMSGD